MKAENLTVREAQKGLESLRKGIPPTGLIEHLTVGRKTQIQGLDKHLHGQEHFGILLKANYGAGKSHLLGLLREKALRGNFATSLVTLDSKSGVRFNRTDQIFGAILRNLEVPLPNGKIGKFADALDFLAKAAEDAKTNPSTPSGRFWKAVTNNWKWDYSERLSSPPLYIAFRAWAATDSKPLRDMILDWLFFPANYKSRRADLLNKLVEGLRRHFRDKRPPSQFYQEDALVFQSAGYQNCWAALQDLNEMFTMAGLAGFIVLFDEFEDILTNLERINWQEAAFWNLFRFVSGDRFKGKTFYAVTPSFAQKCKVLLIQKDRFDFDYNQFDHLPTFEMSPITKAHLLELADRIVAIHQTAYNITVNAKTIEKMRIFVGRAADLPVQDRARHAIKIAVDKLDEAIN